VETTGNKSLQTRTYKQEIQLIQVLESDKQVMGPISAQVPLDWRLGERDDELIGVNTDANIVMGAELADFFFDCWYLKVIMDDGI
jgi:hypothetical protein